jgi:hypothetical protein
VAPGRLYKLTIGRKHEKPNMDMEPRRYLTTFMCAWSCP